MSTDDKPKVTKETCPEADDIMLLTDAARVLGYTRQNAHRQADRGVFTSLRSLGQGTVYIVSTDEVRDMLETRRVRRVEADAAAAE